MKAQPCLKKSKEVCQAKSQILQSTTWEWEQQEGANVFDFITYINLAILVYFILSVLSYITILYGSFPPILRCFNMSIYSNREDMYFNRNLPPVTVMMPFYNERELIRNSLLSVLNST